MWFYCKFFRFAWIFNWNTACQAKNCVNWVHLALRDFQKSFNGNGFDVIDHYMRSNKIWAQLIIIITSLLHCIPCGSKNQFELFPIAVYNWILIYNSIIWYLITSHDIMFILKPGNGHETFHPIAIKHFVYAKCKRIFDLMPVLIMGLAIFPWIYLRIFDKSFFQNSKTNT